jgi:N-acetylgalactosamine-N,N'-diacetylbacillosaminyl-diphospho-undecaprenol 4-alpha-N-acetylgalactosaminyltransferase
MTRTKERRRIAVVINSMSGGGSERTVSYLLEGLKEHFEIHLILFAPIIEYELPVGQVVHYLDNEHGRSQVLNLLMIPVLARRLRAYCEEKSIELVLSFLPRPNFVSCLAKKLGLKIPVFISERVYTPAYYRSSDLSGKIGLWLTKRLYRWADMILPNSARTVEALQKQLQIPGNYHVFKNMIDLRRLEELVSEPINDYTFDGFTFICVAAFRPQKNHKRLLDAFELLDDPSTRLLLVGKGPMLGDTRKYAGTLKSRARITFLEGRTNAVKYVAAADCFVLASDYEGFPNALLESLACGVPAISTDCLTGPRELLRREGDNDAAGILVPVDGPELLATAMEQMKEDDNARAAFGAAGRGRARGYDIAEGLLTITQLIRDGLPTDH